MTIFEVTGPWARRLAKSLICVSLLLASAAATADNPPARTQIVDLANKVDGVHQGFRATTGIELSDDPLPSVRAAAYAVLNDHHGPISAQPAAGLDGCKCPA